MVLELHTDARRNFDQKAVELANDLANSAPASFPERPVEPYWPEVHTAGRITESDIIGPKVEVHIDRFGRETARSISDVSGSLILTGESHARFVELADAVQRTHALKNSVSVNTVRRLTADWLWTTKASSESEPFSAWVLAECESLVRDYTAVVPIFGLHVETDVSIGRVVFRNITRAELNTWAASKQRPFSSEDEAKLFGLAAARLSLYAEESFARGRASEEVDLALGVLRLVSTGAFAPEKPTLAVPLGRERIERSHSILVDKDGNVLYQHALVHPERWSWALDKKFITSTLAPMLEPWSALLTRDERSSFDHDALHSVLLYSHATLYRNISERLIHIFAAVEAHLLRNDNEPIMMSIADRLAFSVGRTAEERREIHATVKRVYGFRSKYVHHAVAAPITSTELELIEKFLRVIVNFFGIIGANLTRFRTRDAFLDALETVKFS